MYEYVLQREDGKVKIVIDLQTSYGSKPKFVVRDIRTCAKGKRKFISIGDLERDGYKYRHTDYEKREEYIKNVFLRYCTIEEIEAAIEDVISQIRPTREEICFRVL